MLLQHTSETRLDRNNTGVYESEPLKQNPVYEASEASMCIYVYISWATVPIISWQMDLVAAKKCMSVEKTRVMNVIECVQCI